jgi:hypothetical protein
LLPEHPDELADRVGARALDPARHHLSEPGRLDPGRAGDLGRGQALLAQLAPELGFEP